MSIKFSKQSIEYGAQLTKNEADYNYSINDTITVIAQKDKGLLSTIYLQDKWSPTEKIQMLLVESVPLILILRIKYFEPRLSLSYQLNNQIKLKGAWGKYYQFVNRIVREDVSQGSRDFGFG